MGSRSLRWQPRKISQTTHFPRWRAVLNHVKAGSQLWAGHELYHLGLIRYRLCEKFEIQLWNRCKEWQLTENG